MLRWEKLPVKSFASLQFVGSCLAKTTLRGMTPYLFLLIVQETNLFRLAHG